jgi:GAF domain-containing protein
LSTERPAEALLKEAFEQDTDLSGLLHRILEIIVRLTKAERGFVLLAKPDGTSYARVVHNMTEQDLPEKDALVSRSIVARVMAENKSLLLEDAQSAAGFSHSRSIYQLALRSVVCTPLHNENACIGVVYLENRSLAGIFSPADLERVEQLGRSVSRRLATYTALRGLIDKK